VPYWSPIASRRWRWKLFCFCLSNLNHCMVLPVIASTCWKIAENMLSKQLRAAILGVGRGGNNFSPLKISLLRNVTHALGIVGLLWIRYWTFGLCEGQGISWLAERLLISEEELCSMELVMLVLNAEIILHRNRHGTDVDEPKKTGVSLVLHSLCLRPVR